MLTGLEKRTTSDQVLSFIVHSSASPRACLTAFLTALLERGIASGSMRSATRLGARAGCGKPVAAMACGRWLWKACGCNGLWPLVVESLSNWGHSMASVCFQSSSGRDSSLS